ncbi:MAG: DUF433 domain-containing protein [Candidatus Paceibacterota bacterium]
MTSQEMQGVISVHIEQTSGVRSGKPRIKGTRLTVADVVLWTEQGMCPDEIVTEFPQLSLADVHAALAYYHDNRDLIDRQIKESSEFVARLRASASDVPETGDLGTQTDGNPISS